MLCHLRFVILEMVAKFSKEGLTRKSTMDIFVGFGMIIVAHLKQSIYFAQINFLEKKF